MMKFFFNTNFMVKKAGIFSKALPLPIFIANATYMPCGKNLSY